MIKLESAVSVEITGFDIDDGLFGVYAIVGASYSLTDSRVDGMIIGIRMATKQQREIGTGNRGRQQCYRLRSVFGASVEINEALAIHNSSVFWF